MEMWREPQKDWEAERKREREERFMDEFFERPFENFPKKFFIHPGFLNNVEGLKEHLKSINEFKNLRIDKLPDTFIRQLENDPTNQRVDEFIVNAVRIPIPPLRQRTVIPEPLTGRFFESRTGLRATSNMRSGFSLTVRGEEVIGSGERYTEIHFTPGGRARFDPRRMTDSLARGIQGIMEMIEAIDHGRFDADQVIVGKTNINMALIAQRLGFAIVDSSRTVDGQIDKTARSFTVVGNLEDIRAKVEEFKVKGTPEKLAQRNQRVPSTVPQPAL